MFTPPGETMSLPSLVTDPNPPFFPPPQGATDGGQPGLYSAFPGMRNNAQPSSSQWPIHGTPYPPPSSWPLSSPLSAPAWGPGGYYAPAGTPLYAPAPQPQLSAGWAGAYTPAGNATGYPTGPATYHPPTPYFTGPPPPSTPYEPVSFVANPTGAYYDSGVQSAGVGGGYTLTPKKSKQRNSRQKRDDYEDDDSEGAGGVGYSISMKRTHSQADPKPRTQLQRSAAWVHVCQQGGYGYGGGYGHEMVSAPAYSRGDLWDEHNPARRPRDWRADFTGPGYLPLMLPSMLKPKTDVREWTDPERREIHPLLLYISAHRIRPTQRLRVWFATLDRMHNDIDLAQLACQPSSPFMRPRLPWYIDVSPTWCYSLRHLQKDDGAFTGAIFGTRR